jgi:acetyl esterase
MPEGGRRRRSNRNEIKEERMLKRILTVLAIVLVLCLAALFVLGSVWQNTAHGKLDFKAALILKMRSVLTKNVPRTAAQMRSDESARGKSLQAAPDAGVSIRDLSIAGPGGTLPLRVYTPRGDGPLPLVLFFHGGGWVIGSLDSAEAACSKIAAAARAVVISVDYRLAPEHPFPAAIDDSFAALEWTSANGKSLGGDPAHIGLAGFSAGANLAAATALMARDRKGPRLSCQALVYPAVNLCALDTASFRSFSDGYALSREDVEFFIGCYVPDAAARKNPYVSPLLAPTLAGLPPALVITAGFDVLRDEGRDYAGRLSRAGVACEHAEFPTMVHGFVNMGRLFPEAGDALAKVSAFLAKRLRD